MIETREDWEHVKTVAELQSGPSLQHAVETIEALRDVARDILYIKKGWHMCRLCNEASPDEPVHEEHCPMNALSDWITKNGR